MPEVKKVDMVATGSISVGVSSARGSRYKAYCTNYYRPCCRSGGLLMLANFFSKTTEMNSNIFDVGAGQESRFLSAQDDLPESAIDQPTSQNIDTPANEIFVVVNNTSTKESTKISGSCAIKYQGWWCQVLDMEKHGRFQLKLIRKISLTKIPQKKEQG